MQPYLLSREEWGKRMTADLWFGVCDDLADKLKKVWSGEITVTTVGRIRFITELKHPVSYADVRRKAIKIRIIERKCRA